MDKKKIIIIVAVIAIIALVGGYLLLNNNTSHSDTTKHVTILLSKSAYMEVPDSPNATNKVDKKGIFYYNVNKDDVNITSCSNLSASSSAKEMKEIKNSVATGSKKIKEDNVVLYEKNGTYSVFVRNTQYNDTLLIQSSDKELLLSCWKSVKYHDPTTKIDVDNTTSSSGSGSVVSAVEKTESTVQKETSSSASSSSSTGTSSKDWGYDWSSGSSSSSKSSSSSGKVGGSASSSSQFDFS